MCPTGTSLHPTKPSVKTTSQFKQAFAIMDADHDGKISNNDLQTFYASVASNPVSTNDYEEDMIKAMINVADSNKNGFVEYDEFEGVLNNKNNNNEIIHNNNNGDNGIMEELFKVMDKDCDGKLGFDDLKSYLELVGIRVCNDDINSMIQLGGANNISDGVSFLEFVKILDLQF